jgi:hypothetical protein
MREKMEGQSDSTGYSCLSKKTMLSKVTEIANQQLLRLSQEQN